MTGTAGSAPPGWYATDHGWRWWDGAAWGPLAPAPLPTSEAEAGKGVAILSHLGILLGGFILPLVIYLSEGKRNRFVRDHSREALNFQISLMIVWFAAFVAFIVVAYSATAPGDSGPPTAFFVVVPLMWGLGIFGLVCSILGAVRAGAGRPYRYPVSIRFVRG